MLCTQNGIRTNPAPESDEQQSGVSSIPVASQDARVPDTSEDEPQSESEISGFDIIKQGPNSWVSPDMFVWECANAGDSNHSQYGTCHSLDDHLLCPHYHRPRYLKASDWSSGPSAPQV